MFLTPALLGWCSFSSLHVQPFVICMYWCIACLSLEHQLRENNRKRIFLLFTAVSLGPRTVPDTQYVPDQCLLNRWTKICPQGDNAGIVSMRIPTYMTDTALTVNVCKLAGCEGSSWKAGPLPPGASV